MTDLILAGIVGLVVGIGASIGMMRIQPPPQQPDQTSETQQEIIKQLTSLDIVDPLCKPEQIKTSQDLLLCRELTCLSFTRGIDSKTGGGQCEEISNISNKIIQMDYCNERKTAEGQKACLEIFWRRQ